jgi:hypothetical protein
MGRTILYHTIEEKRAANNLSARKYKERKRAEAQALPPPVKEPKPLPVSYTREYHQQRYKLQKEAKKALLNATQTSVSDVALVSVEPTPQH